MKVQFTRKTALAVGAGGTYVPALQATLLPGVNEVPDEVGHILIRAGLVEQIRESHPAKAEPEEQEPEKEEPEARPLRRDKSKKEAKE